ncbi:DUF58 domain-containing protein [Hydrogenophaga sp.]|uniref:DUF58 domain-containing protein n=1 Tax=Hydrogenophaga sp. TaxID=1904254 RepID=UPI0027193D9E|nr:DUF58 domain-containing protein [Hydrogenophaga sp.]MDO9437361.1 DUF58 domain-containing protein [Hydrogenophaga sp.]
MFARLFGKKGEAQASVAATATPAARRAETLLRRLEWTVLRRLDGLLQGDYRTLMRGSGLDLADLREYQHHDDVRHIDWNVTARLQTPHVRVFTEDREMAAWFLLDLSPSVNFGSGPQLKSQVLLDFTAVLARLIGRHGNRVGAVLYGSRGQPVVDAVLPARGGRTQVLRLMQMVLQPPAPKPGVAAQKDGVTQLSDLLRAAVHTVRQRATVFVVSDFISEPGWEKPLGELARRHDVVAVRVLDPLELELPDLGLIPIRDAETGDQITVDTHDPGFRQRFARIAAQREAQLRESLGRAGVDTLELSTDDDLAEAVMRFIELRKRRQRESRNGLNARHVPTQLPTRDRRSLGAQPQGARP